MSLDFPRVFLSFRSMFYVWIIIEWGQTDGFDECSTIFCPMLLICEHSIFSPDRFTKIYNIHWLHRAQSTEILIARNRCRNEKLPTIGTILINEISSGENKSHQYTCRYVLCTMYGIWANITNSKMERRESKYKLFLFLLFRLIRQQCQFKQIHKWFILHEVHTTLYWILNTEQLELRLRKLSKIAR